MSDLPFVTETVPVAPPLAGSAVNKNDPATRYAVSAVIVNVPAPPGKAVPHPFPPIVMIAEPPTGCWYESA
jgi:hypothetical protein